MHTEDSSRLRLRDLDSGDVLDEVTLPGGMFVDPVLTPVEAIPDGVGLRL